jgi:hypothetical protein
MKYAGGNQGMEELQFRILMKVADFLAQIDIFYVS